MADGTAKVLTLDGVIHDFPDPEAAEHWLSEDEYSRHLDLVWSKEIPLSLKPPTASSDADLVRKMRVNRRR